MDASAKLKLTRKYAVPRCTTYATLGIPVHRFPKTECMLLKWLEALVDVNIHSISTQTIICGLHFKKSDYINPEAKSRRLRPDAVPSLHFAHDHILIMSDELLSSEEELDITKESSIIADNEVDSDNTCIENEESTEVNNNSASDIEKIMSTGVSIERSVINSVVEKLEEDIMKSVVKKLEEDVVNYVLEKLEEDEISVDKGVQTESDTNAEKVVQTVIIVSTEKESQTDAYSFLHFLKNDADLLAFTGVKFSVLEALVKSVKLIQNKLSNRYLCSLEERIVLTLCKLRLNLSFLCLGVLFKISRSIACNYFSECVHLLACVLEEAIYFPDREEIQHNLPMCFNKFQDTRIILDCTEMAVQNSKCLQCRLKMYSHYKGKQTLKVLIGITPSGLISYCSKYYGGRASDKSIFLQSGLLKRLIPGQDAIIVDKGFMIKSECNEVNIKLIRPPFANKTNQMSQEDSFQTRNIAAARVHVERSIQRIITFVFLKLTIDWDMTKYINEIMTIIYGLVNLGSPIINKIRYSI